MPVAPGNHRRPRPGQGLHRRPRGDARQQLVNISQLPIIHHHVAAMPDVHAGIGATVGSVIATQRAIIPAAVGVDIGCGMIAARTSLTANRARREEPEARLRPDLARRAGRPRPASRNGRESARCQAVRARAEADPREASRASRSASAARELGAADGHARRRQPLHRGVPRRSAARLGDAALGQPRHRQRDRHLLHRARRSSDMERHQLQPARPRPRLLSRKARSTSTTTSRRSTGRRTMRRPTATR